MSGTPPASQVNAIEMESVRQKKKAMAGQHGADMLGRAGDVVDDPVSLPHIPAGAGGSMQGQSHGTGTGLGRYKSFRKRGM